MVRLEETEAPAGYCERIGENLLKKYDIPLHHLDFAYVGCCEDGRELEKIHQVLKSGQEGYYPELLRATEDRLAQVKPDSKCLRKPTPVLSKSEIDEDELKKITEDFDEWLGNVNRNDDELEAAASRGFPRDIPEVRKAFVGRDEKGKTTAKRIASTDYESWDKFDAETEMLKMDLEDEKMRKSGGGGESRKKSVSFGGFTTKAEALYEANREKEKGNDFFKVGEYESALEHYANGIAHFPGAILYTNRAAAHLKMRNFEGAIADCERALKHEPKNQKAHLRMAQAFEALNKPDDALLHAENAIRIDPNNSSAQQIARRARESTGQDEKIRNVRLKIVDLEEEKKKKKNAGATEIIPIAGSSRMRPPYFKVAGEKQQFTASAASRIFFLPPAEDECECLEQHIRVRREAEEEKEDGICLRTDEGENYVVVDNRGAPSTVERERLEGGRGKNKAGKNSSMVKGKGKGKSDVQVETEANDLQIKFAANTDEDVPAEEEGGGGGEPHIPRQESTPNVPGEIHLPYTFIKTWQSAKRDGSYRGFARIIRSLNMERITEAIGNKIDATILSDTINCLHRHFAVADEVRKVYETLTNLCRLERFRIVVLFLSDGDKRLLKNLLEFLGQHGRPLPDDVKTQYGL